MIALRDAGNDAFIREATEAERDASDEAAAWFRMHGSGDALGSFALPCGRRVYVPLDPLPDDGPIGGPGGD